MATPEPLITAAPLDRESFASLSARRLLTLAGIGMILAGMIFGDIFAVFVLHQNAARVGSSLAAAAQAAADGDVATVASHFKNTGEFLENRGTKVDTHVHLIAFGYLALMLAMVQPWVKFAETSRRRLAWLLVFGAVLLPVGVFLIRYVGLAYSPLQTIGWASIFADLGGLMVLAATFGFLVGIGQHFLAGQALPPDKLLRDRSTPARWLLVGGLCLILAGFVHGAYYAGRDLYRHEEADYTILSQMSSAAAAHNQAQINQSLADYGQLQGDKAVKIAAHAHIIEFGLLAMLLAFFQSYVQLGDIWKRRWAVVLLLGSLLLPVCVLLEMKYGLLAGGIADSGGLLVIVALLAMWIGILRYTGSVDAMPSGVQP
ncbi:MAG TPA: hypothetical protein VE604_13910 [Candidatus Polarisedimenticolia bacterium]|jgi:hypothetical protein|nr:hypothetical protein [Candidatus Polarisedimenticolia bacterium]